MPFQGKANFSKQVKTNSSLDLGHEKKHIKLGEKPGEQKIKIKK